MTDSRFPTPDSRPLRGIAVLVTRPAHQADNLCRLIEAQGGTALRLPLLAVEPAQSPAQAARLLDGARGHDWWVFTSANAVRHAAQLHRNDWTARLAAVGPATAAALDAAGQSVHAAPVSGASAEALLEAPELQDVRGRKILVVTGVGGLDVLAEGLRGRGAEVAVAEVYRRVPLPYPPQTVEEALRKAQIILVTSGEALEHLFRLAPLSARAALLKKPLVAPSQRVVEQARQLGFARPQAVPEPMSDAAILRCLAACGTFPT